MRQKIPTAGSFSLDAATEGIQMQTSAKPKVTWNFILPRTDFAFSSSGDLMAAPMSEANTLPPNRTGPASSGRIGIWSAESWELLHSIDDLPKKLLATAWRSDDQRLAVAGQWSVRIYRVDGDSSEFVTEIDVEDSVTAMSFHGNLLAIGSAYSVVVWELATGSEARTEMKKRFSFGGATTFAAFSPTGKHLAVVEQSAAELRVINVEDGKLLYRKPAPRAVTCVQFSPHNSEWR